MSFQQHYEWTEITQSLYEAFEGLADKVYLTTRPSVVRENIDSFIVIRLSSGIRDRGDTYQTAKPLVHIFVRDKAGEIENAPKLDEIAFRLCKMMPLVTPRATAYDPNFIASGADAGFHYQIYQLSLTINKRDIKEREFDFNY